jgi:serine/threonine protein kinase
MEEMARRSMDPTASEGRKTVNIVDVRKQKISLANFKIIDKLGGGSFGSVFLVRPQGKNKTNQLFAMKVLEKENVLKQKLARYALTERNVLCVAGKHPHIVGLDFAFQNRYRLYLIMEFCPGGDLGK